MLNSFVQVEDHWRKLLWVCHFHKKPLSQHRTISAADLKKAIFGCKRDLLQLWESYNSDREAIGKLPTTSARILMPYLLGFHLPNAARTYGTIARVELSQSLQKFKTLHVIDLGCGTGAMSAPWLLEYAKALPTATLHYWPIDRSPYFIDLACKGAQLIKTDINLQPQKMDLKNLAQLQSLRKLIQVIKPNELIQINIGYLLNELHNPQPLGEFINELLSADRPVLVHLLEAARENEARLALELREFLVENGAQVLYPCPKSLTCPLTGKNWCFSEFNFQAPKELQIVEKQLNLHRRQVGASSYVFTSPNLARQFDHQRKQVFVGLPKLQSGQHVSLVCDGTHITREKPQFKLRRGELFGLQAQRRQ